MTRPAVLLTLIVFPVLVSARIGARGPYEIVLNLGPGDTPYVEGFVPEYEVEGSLRVHWSTRAASVRLPLTVQGGPISVSYSFARPLLEPAVVNVQCAGLPIDHFSFPGGRFREREIRIPAIAESPLDLSFYVDSSDIEGLGLRFDWIRIELGPSARANLHGWHRWAPTAIVLLIWTVLVASGWTPSIAAFLAAPAAAVATVGLVWDPWLTHRVTAVLLPGLALFGLGLTLFSQFLRGRGILSPLDVRLVAALMTAAFLLRAGAIAHPSFYHPDLRTHARFVQVIREDGREFFVSPSRSILRHGVWKRRAFGQEYAFPYSPAFHLPFVPLPLGYDELVTYMPIVAAAWSTVPVALVWILACRLGLSRLGALLMVLIPTYTSRLSYAFLPSLFGHVVDVMFICWISFRLDRLDQLRVFLVGTLLLASCQLAYVSGGLNIGAFALALCGILVLGGSHGRYRSFVIAGMLIVATALAIAIYYRDFLGMVVDVIPRALGATPGQPLYPTRSFLAVTYERIRSFFDGIYPLLTVAGLWIIAKRRVPNAPALGAWALAYLLLLLARAKMPDIFLRAHESLFATPLFCLASGETLATFLAHSKVARTIAQLLLVALAIQGFYFQWNVVAGHIAAVP